MMKISEKHVQVAIQSLLLFARVALKNKVLSPQFVEALQQQCAELLGQISLKKMETASAIAALNALIKNMNGQFREQTQTAQYPLFSASHPEQQLKSEILAFEHYINQQLRSKKLPLQKEKDLFQEAMILWKNVGPQLSAKQGVANFSHLVKKLNDGLQDPERYPMPDDSFYA